METIHPDLQAALVCEDVRLEINGVNSLVGVVNAIVVNVVPFRVMKLCVFTRWVSGQGDFSQKVQFLLPEEETPFAISESKFRLAGAEQQATCVSVFGGLELPKAGDYPVEIYLDNDLILRFPLRVVIAQPRTTQTY